MSVAANLSRINEILAKADVTLIAVSKYVEMDGIREAIDCGVTEFGESRLADAIKKQSQLPPELAERTHWHFIGHLQTNKVKKAVGKFDLIHSVDSIRLAKEISDEAVKKEILQPVLLQVKMLTDPNKSGFSPKELKESLACLRELPGIKIEGLMTISPLTQDRSVWRECFLGLRQLREELEQEQALSLKELSMGMSDDWMEAVGCGATMVRIGRAIFDKLEN